jgi:hypothetical protein
MAQQPAATPVIQEPMATPRSKEDFGTDTPREGSDANSPEENGQLRKRKYEEATEDEKLALNQYHIQNPQLKQVNKPFILWPLPLFSYPREPNHSFESYKRH